MHVIQNNHTRKKCNHSKYVIHLNHIIVFNACDEIVISYIYLIAEGQGFVSIL